MGSRLALTVLIFIAAHLAAGQSSLRAAAKALREFSSNVGQSKSTEKQVGPGVFHRHEIESSGPLNFNVLRVDLSNPYIHAEVEQGRDRLFTGAKLTDIARRETQPRHSVIGAINGDFWSFSPMPFYTVGMMVGDGTLWTMPSFRSVALFMQDGQIKLTTVTLKLSAQIGESLINIPRINDVRASTTLALYTHVYNSDYPAGNARYYLLRLVKPELLPNKPVAATVHRITEEPTSATSAEFVILRVPFPTSDVAISKLQNNSRLVLHAIMPSIDGIVRECVGGGPRIVRDGKVSVEHEAEQNGPEFASDRHPRTAIGVSSDGKTGFFVTVDGRQPLVSIGQSLYELADYMIKLGCSDAINLDGGGSTTMVVRGEVVNRSSDLRGPRTVANGVVLVSTAPTGPLAELEIVPSSSPLLLPAGTKAQFRVNGYDSNFNPVPVPAPKWESNIATIHPDQDSAIVLLSEKSADGTLEVSSGSIKAMLPIRTETPSTIKLSPEVLVLSSGETADISIAADGPNGKLHLQDQMILLAAEDDSVSASISEVSGIKKGSGKLEIKIGSAVAVLPYYVDEFKSVTLSEFDSSPTRPLTGAQYMDEGTEVAIETNCKQSGSASLAFNYAMMKGGTTKIALPVNLQVDQRPAKFSVWVYGDGKEAWLRGEVVDSAGRRFMLDFTDGSKGIYWKDEWRHIMVPTKRLIPRNTNPGAIPQYPITITEVYLAQDQEALKARGMILIDNLQAIYPPDRP